MKFPPTFWVLHNMNKQYDAHSLSILIQELVISQLTRKAKVKMKTPFTQMVDRLLTYYLHSNNKGKKKGGPGNTEYDHKHKLISPNHIRDLWLNLPFLVYLLCFISWLLLPIKGQPLICVGLFPALRSSTTYNMRWLLRHQFWTDWTHTNLPN